MESPGRKKSPAWDYFTVAEDPNFAVCKACKKKVSCSGKNSKCYETMNLVQHLRVKHAQLHIEFQQKVEVQNAATSSSSPAPFSQIPLQESGDRVRVWDINDARAQRIHRRIGEMIALDCEPFSVVKDQGFKQLIRELEPRYTLPSRKYFTECIISGMFTELKAELKKEIDDVAHFSFTTDVWTTNVSNDSLLSLTAHWLTDSFTTKTAVLHTQLLEESHTGTYLAEKLTQMLASWEIPSDKVHLVLRDNGANMVKAMRDASLPAIGCVAHTLQLVVHDGVLSQRAVTGLLAACRKIVGHFKHSSLAYCRLKEIQQTLDCHNIA